MPGLADLFMEATKAWNGGKGPRMLCEECQVLAEQILEVNKGLQQLPDDLSEVSSFVRGVYRGHRAAISLYHGANAVPWSLGRT